MVGNMRFVSSPCRICQSKVVFGFCPSSSARVLLWIKEKAQPPERAQPAVGYKSPEPLAWQRQCDREFQYGGFFLPNSECPQAWQPRRRSPPSLEAL